MGSLLFVVAERDKVCWGQGHWAKTVSFRLGMFRTVLLIVFEA
jgi:hypothetical protein